jgi:Tol biopolymer transport system component
MTSTRDLDRQLGSWFEARATTTEPDGLLERSLARVDATRQRPGWLVGGVHVSPRLRGRAAVVPAWAILLLVALAALAVVAMGAGLLLRSTPVMIVQPTPSSSLVAQTPNPSASASPTPTHAGPLGGGLILAYVSHVPHARCFPISGAFDSPGPYDVLTLDPATGTPTVLGTTIDDCSSHQLGFQWAPDRTHVLMTGAFSQDGIGLTSLTDSGRRITFVCCNLPTDIWQGGSIGGDGWRLSPRGDRVAAIHTSPLKVPGQQGETGIADGIVVADVDGGGVRMLPLPAGADAQAGGLTWSPDESSIAVSACRPCNYAAHGQPPTTIQHDHLFIVPVDGSPVRQFLDDTRGSFAQPAWSPDGSVIAVLRNDCAAGESLSQCTPERRVSTLETVGAADGRLQTLTTGQAGAPAWSPDGRSIAFTVSTYNVAGATTFVIAADGTGLTKLADGDFAAWSPDGQWLLLTRLKTGRDLDLWIVPADGGDPRAIGTYRGAAW